MSVYRLPALRAVFELGATGSDVRLQSRLICPDLHGDLAELRPVQGGEQRNESYAPPD